MEKCISCNSRFDEGDEYIHEPIFGDKLCTNCIPELKESLKMNEDWISLQQLDSNICKVKIFALHAKSVGVKK